VVYHKWAAASVSHFSFRHWESAIRILRPLSEHCDPNSDTLTHADDPSAFLFIYLFIYLFNPQLDTMRIKTYNSKHANCKTSRQSTVRCLHS